MGHMGRAHFSRSSLSPQFFRMPSSDGKWRYLVLITSPDHDQVTSYNTRSPCEWHRHAGPSTSRARKKFTYIFFTTYIVQVHVLYMWSWIRRNPTFSNRCVSELVKDTTKVAISLAIFTEKNPKNLCCIRYLVFTIQNSTRFRASCLHVLKILTTVLYSHFSGLLWQEDCKGSNATCYKVTSHIYKLCKITSSKCSKINSE